MNQETYQRIMNNKKYHEDMRPEVITNDNKNKKWSELSWYLKKRLINNYLIKHGEPTLPYDIRNYKFYDIAYDNNNRVILQMKFKIKLDHRV